MIITDVLIDKNKFSRPGTKLLKVRGIVIHYTACPKASSSNIRNYFQNLSEQTENDLIEDRSASAHYVVGLNGEVLRMIPDEEVAYHVGANSYKLSFGDKSPNHYLIGIECCHEDATGRFNEKTYQATLELVTNLLKEYDLTPWNVYRHYDITGKNCPKYFVENPDSWNRFRLSLEEI